MSANFLIILLDCIEKWALTFQYEDAEQENNYFKSYKSLLDIGVKFPSTFKTGRQEAMNQSLAKSGQFDTNLSVKDDNISMASSSSDKKTLIANLKKKM